MNRTLLLALAATAGFAAGSRVLTARYSFRDKVVAVTGGSRGLGLTIAQQLAREGARIAILARNAGELENAAEQIAGESYPVVCDVRDEQQVNRAIDRISNEFGPIDVLINNAGIIQVGPSENMTLEDFEQAMSVHFWGPLYTIRAVLPQMKRRGSGRIVNIASIGGEVAVPHLAPYCASKYALVGLSDALRAEMRRHGVYVTTICPWLMRTGSFPYAVFKGQSSKEYTWFGLSDAVPGVSMNADKAARRIINACRDGRARVTLGLPGKLAVLVNAIAPGWLAFGQSVAGWLLPSPTSGDSIGRPGWQVEREGGPHLSQFA